MMNSYNPDSTHYFFPETVFIYQLGMYQFDYNLNLLFICIFTSVCVIRSKVQAQKHPNTQLEAIFATNYFLMKSLTRDKYSTVANE